MADVVQNKPASDASSGTGGGQVAAEAPEVAVLVLNWRRYDETQECLESLQSLEIPPRPRVYLIDQESDTAALGHLVARFPEVVAIPLSGNLGYAGGMNRGIERALADGAKYLMLLNNDARMTPPVVRQLLALFKSHLHVGVAGPSLRFLPPDERVVSIGLEVNRWSGRVHLRHHGGLPENLYPYPHQVDAVSGACLMISAEVLREIGPLDESYFFYFEDVDLCLRARAAGWNVYCIPTAVVYHEGGATMGESPDRVYYGVRNQLKVIAERGLNVAQPIAWGRNLYIVGLHLAQILSEKRVDTPSRLHTLWEGTRDFRRRSFGPRPPGGS